MSGVGAAACVLASRSLTLAELKEGKCSSVIMPTPLGCLPFEGQSQLAEQTLQLPSVTLQHCSQSRAPFSSSPFCLLN